MHGPESSPSHRPTSHSPARVTNSPPPAPSSELPAAPTRPSRSRTTPHTPCALDTSSTQTRPPCKPVPPSIVALALLLRWSSQLPLPSLPELPPLLLPPPSELLP